MATKQSLDALFTLFGARSAVGRHDYSFWHESASCLLLGPSREVAALVSGGVTRKRARIDSETEPVEEPVDSGATAATAATASGTHRDEHFWFEDGTVILVAGDVEFRVYKGILATYSPLFKDMFSLPQPLQQDSNVPCPVVALTDPPGDVRHLLRMCMPHVNSSPYLPATPPFPAVAACVRLAHKYQMAQLLDHSLNYLKTFYPTTLEAWIAAGTEFKKYAIGVVNIARLTGCDSLLPSALLICYGLGETIVRGYERDDGSREQLSLADIGLCYEAKGRLIEAGVGVGAAMHVMLKLIEERDLEERQRVWKELPYLLGIYVEGWEGDEVDGQAPETG
ncbi:hypothetical protein C8T65DRAFT_697345 [Cerioporus squamosus]|nr:hypothetical protein C8T65DRAFT_697345 [Cerioporus squamosus]